MKELSIEQKARAYDESLERAKNIYGASECKDILHTLETIFPELKESRDEKIRKLLIRLFKSNTNEKFDDVSTQDIIAWLEKQETSYTKRVVEDAYIEGVVSTKNELEKQGEPSLKAEQSGMQILNMWSEKDEHRAKDTIYFLDTAKKHYASTVELDACIDWLKSLKDKVQPQPQPKQDWSEEDEHTLQGVIDEIQANKSQAPDYDFETYDRFLSWLKSLKQRIGG